jgi:hypothetical protein
MDHQIQNWARTCLHPTFSPAAIFLSKRACQEYPYSNVTRKNPYLQLTRKIRLENQMACSASLTAYKTSRARLVKIEHI